MTRPLFIAMPTEAARAYQAGKPDANGQAPERHISDGDGVPCRHCLNTIAKGDPYLIIAYRPFPGPQPYAEVGPIFLHAEKCERYEESTDMPPILRDRAQYLIRGYGQDDRIKYGTGQSVPSAELADTAARLLEREEIAYVHVRSATNNCYQCRIEQA